MNPLPYFVLKAGILLHKIIYIWIFPRNCIDELLNDLFNIFFRFVSGKSVIRFSQNPGFNSAIARESGVLTASGVFRNRVPASSESPSIFVSRIASLYSGFNPSIAFSSLSKCSLFCDYYAGCGSVNRFVICDEAILCIRSIT